MFVLETETIEWEPVVKNHRTGTISRKFIRESEAALGVGYTADLVWYEPGGPFDAPRHRHTFDQLRFTISGEVDYGMGQVATGGQVTFFPAGAYYGPEHIDAAQILLVQWSRDWVTREMSDAAFSRLETRGEFADGKYVTTDASGNQVTVDSVDAVWEEAIGRPVSIPVAKYPQPVIMNPDGFAWKAAGDHVQFRDLGHLDEDFNPVQYKLSPGGQIELTDERTQILWVSDGRVTIDERALGAGTIVFSDPGEALTVTAEAESTAMVFAMPTGSTPL